MTGEQKAIAAPLAVTAVVVTAGDLEARIGQGEISIVRTGPRGGRTKLIDLDARTADRFLELVAHGRSVLAEMDGT